MKRTGETDDLLPPGEASRQVGLMQRLYRGPSSPTCADCGGKGADTTRTTGGGGGYFACRTCSGTGRSPA